MSSQFGYLGMLRARLGQIALPRWREVPVPRLEERSRLVLNRVNLALGGLPNAFDGYRIAHLTDLHFGPCRTHSTITQAIDWTAALGADLIVITGDFVTKHLDNLHLPDALCRLAAPDGVWAVLGNHDHATDAAGVRAILAASGVHELRNTNARLTRDSESIWLAGVDDICTGHHDLDAALDGIPDGAATILLAHEPDYADEVASTRRVSLQLSGHSHGEVIPRAVLDLPSLSKDIMWTRNYPRGLYLVGEMCLYTNSGLGNGFLPRVRSRPEVAEIILRAA